MLEVSFIEMPSFWNGTIRQSPFNGGPLGTRPLRESWKSLEATLRYVTLLSKKLFEIGVVEQDIRNFNHELKEVAKSRI